MVWLRNIICGLGLLLVLWFGGRSVVRFFAPEETRIHWTVEGMVDGFNDTNLRRSVRPLAPEFVDRTADATRDDVQNGLRALFFRSQDPVTKKFLYRLEIPEETFEVEVRDTSPKTAELEMTAHFYESKGGSEYPGWEIRIRAQLEKRDVGWRFVKSEHEVLSGSRPL